MSRDRPIARILQVHTRYRLAGGEDAVVEAERRLLETGGLHVCQVIFDNADLRESRSLAGDIGLAASAIWSRSAERRVRAAIVAHQPDVIHVHNTFPAASPSVYSVASALDIPVVQTLHNYRFVCPAATAFRDGRVCTDCVGRSIPWPAVVHACVRRSHAQSLIAATTITAHRALGTFRRGISTYVALTAFQRDLMIAGGVPGESIRVIPNFLEPDPGPGLGDRAGLLFVGRLSDEKGISVLLEAASREPGIAVAGGGPLAEAVRQAQAAGHVDYLGTIERAATLEHLRRARALILPSIWFEGLPLVVLEAFASATPVIASRIGSLAELIEDGVTGLLVKANDPGALAEACRWANDHPTELRAMGANARQRYEARYRGAMHLNDLRGAYEAATATPG